MATKIYGASDDLIEFEGDVRGEVGCYGTAEKPRGVLLVCSDGTIAEVKYGKMDQGIWGIHVFKEGTLFCKLDLCDNEDADPYSDVLHFKDGLKWAYAAKEWDRVK